MEKNIWEHILQNLENLHYTGLLWFISTLLALIIGIKYYRNELSYKLLIIYCISSLLMLNIIHDCILFSFDKKDHRRIIYGEGTNTLFAFVEISIFFYFFRQLLNNKIIQTLIKIFWIIFTILCIAFIIEITEVELSKVQIIKNSYYINIFEFFLLLPLCLVYFFQLLTKEQNNPVQLTDSPSFWIVSGLFFYCIVSLPFLFYGKNSVIRSASFFYLIGAIHYISISLLFLCLTKAFSCKKTLTT